MAIYLAMLRCNFRHPCSSVVNQNYQQESLIAHREHIVMEVVGVLATILLHSGIVIPNARLDNARGIDVNHMNIIDNVFAHGQ